MSIETLDRYGIKYTQDYKIPRDPADAGRPLRDEKGEVVKEYGMVNSVLLPLSSVEWCHIAMRDGKYYVGGCCGHCGVLQDTINDVFRSGGWVGHHLLRKLAELAIHHEGFEAFEDTTLLEKTESLAALDNPWDKIAVVWQAVKDILSVSGFDQPTTVDITDFDSAAYLVGTAMYHLATSTFFRAEDPESMEGGQQQVNQTYAMCKILPALHTVYEHLKKMGTQEFHAFGVRHIGSTEPTSNYHGLCLYRTREHAEELLELWKKTEDHDATLWEIVPCVVTVDGGLQWSEQ